MVIAGVNKIIMNTFFEFESSIDELVKPPSVARVEFSHALPSVARTRIIAL